LGPSQPCLPGLSFTSAGLGDDELDVAVFRFTLGIPGFDDSNIPRVVGAAVALLVAINHAVVADPPPAQVKQCEADDCDECVYVCLGGGG
jgi:hypothetical protein